MVGNPLSLLLRRSGGPFGDRGSGSSREVGALVEGEEGEEKGSIQPSAMSHMVRGVAYYYYLSS